MEVAMKLLEKDIHEKQDTIISLRRQLDDIKIINLEMYKKLQVKPSQGDPLTKYVGKPFPNNSDCFYSWHLIIQYSLTLI